MTFEEILPFLKKGEKIKRRCCDKNCYLYLKADIIFDQTDDVVHLSGYDLISDDWEVYVEPIDWNYVIEHKCLCKFWDIDQSVYFLGYLNNFKELDYYKYSMISSSILFHNCRPIKKSEINFYEDKENGK